MAFTVVYDACVLFPVALRDLFIRLGQTGLFRPKWSERILQEFAEAVRHQYPDIGARLERQLDLMREALRDAEVVGYAQLIPAVPALPDPNDAHVVAAAMEARAEVIVTFNLGDFPTDVLAPLKMEAQHPDTFVRHLIDLERDALVAVISDMAAAKSHPPMTYDEVLDVLARRGLVQSAQALRGADA
jgi:predicted nucleic acid-binding protein